MAQVVACLASARPWDWECSSVLEGFPSMHKTLPGFDHQYHNKTKTKNKNKIKKNFSLSVSLPTCDIVRLVFWWHWGLNSGT
jgi:hypothetical protein